MFKNGLYNTIGGVARIGISLLSVPIIIRLIGIESYGIWILSSSVISIAALVEGGLSVTTTFYLSKDIANNDNKGLSETLTATLATILFLSTLSSFFLYFSSDYIVRLFPQLQGNQSEVVLNTLQLGSLYLWPRLIQQQFIGIMQAYEEYGLINVLGTLQNIISSFGLILVAYFSGNAVEMMKWQAVISIIALLIYLRSSKKLIQNSNPRVVWNFIKIKQIWKYSLVAWFGTLGSALFTQGDRLIVGSILNVKVLGIYSAISTVASQINILSSLPILPLVPKLAKLLKTEKDNRHAIKAQIKESQELNAVVALVSAGSIILFSKSILLILIKENTNVESIFAMQVSALIYAIYSLNAVGYFSLYGLGEIKLCTLIHVFSSITTLFLILVLSLKFGFLGAIYGNVGYVITLLMVVLSFKKLRINLKYFSEWLWLPMSCFAILVSISFMAQDTLSMYYQIFLLTIFTAILIIWFLVNNPELKKLLRLGS